MQNELELAAKFFGSSDGSEIPEGEYRNWFQQSMVFWYRRAKGTERIFTSVLNRQLLTQTVGRTAQQKEVFMSEWFDVTNQDDVDLSDDGKEVHILFATNRNGNRYVSVPVELLVKLLAAQRKSCEGACENHVGEVVTVHVTSPKGNDWGEFDYCEEAIAEDRRRGFTVEIE